MKVTLVFFESMATGRQSCFGYASYRLALDLLEKGRLDRIVTQRAVPQLAIPREKLRVMYEHPGYRLAARVIGKLGRVFPWINARRLREELFDRFASSRIDMGPDTLVFATRPLIANTIDRAKAAGATVWLFASVPHPLSNFALGRNEEIRHGLAKGNPVTDLLRTERLTRAMAQADRIVTTDPAIGAYVYGTFVDFVEPERLLTLEKYFPLDPAEYSALTGPRALDPQKKATTFLHVSHINLFKGIPYLLDAWRIFKASDRTGSRLVLVGYMEDRLQRMIDEQYGDLEGLEIRGFVPDLMPHFIEADVFVSPSITDAGPVTIIEAMAAGLPVISSNNCGFASLLTDGEDGFRYQFNDVPALARILERVASRPEDLPRLSRNAFENAQKRSMDEYIEELSGILGDYLERDRLQSSDDA